MSRPIPFVLLAAGLTVAAALPSTPVRAEDPARFVIEFDPEDGAVWERVTTDRRVQDLGTIAPIHEQVTDFTVRVEYDAQPDGSWHAIQTTEDVLIVTNGEEVENTMLPMIREQEIRVVLNAAGQAVDALGFRDLMRRYEQGLPQQDYEKVSRSMNPRNMVEGEKHRWNRTLDGLRGVEFEVGEVLGLDTKVDMQGHWIPVRGVVEVGRWTEIDGERGVTITLRYDASGALRAAAADRIERTIEQLEDREIAQGDHGLDIDGEVVVVVQPSTGQILYETLDQTILVPIQQGAEQKGRLEHEIRTRWRRLEAGS